MKILGPPFISSIIVVIFLFLIVQYWLLLRRKLLRKSYLIILLRIVSLLYLSFLLINPWLVIQETANKPQKISIIYDLSESMFSHIKNYVFDYNDIKERISSWADQTNINIKFHKLSSDIEELDGFKLNDYNTNYTNIPTFIAYHQPQQIILITDGVATVGKNINEIEFNKSCPIHTLGVGPLELKQDIEILEVIVPEELVKGDSVNIDIRIKTLLNNNMQTNLKVNNGHGDELFIGKVELAKGESLIDYSFNIATDFLFGNNIIKIDAINNEYQVENNNYSFIVDIIELDKNIILLTGSLSSNSRLIKQILNSIENINLHHYYQLDENSWNEKIDQNILSNAKLIVLDDYPINQDDNELFSNIVFISDDASSFFFSSSKIFVISSETSFIS